LTCTTMTMSLLMPFTPSWHSPYALFWTLSAHRSVEPTRRMFSGPVALEVVDVGVVDLRTEVKIVSGDAEYEHQDQARTLKTTRRPQRTRRRRPPRFACREDFEEKRRSMAVPSASRCSLFATPWVGTLRCHVDSPWAPRSAMDRKAGRHSAVARVLVE